MVFGVVPKPWQVCRAEQDIQIRQLTHYKRISNEGKYVRPIDIMTAFDDWERANNKLKDKLGMPRANKETVKWEGFINIRMSSEQKEAFENWGLTDEEVWHSLMGVIERDHKFTLTYNSKNGTVNAAFTGGIGSGNNRGWTMSAFAKDWNTAVRALMFKHIEIAAGDWKSVGSVDGDEYG